MSTGRVVQMRRRPAREITVTYDEERVTDAALDALAHADRGVYTRGGRLVHVVTDDHAPRGVTRVEPSPRITAVERPKLRELLASAASWWSDDKKPGPLRPPTWAVQAALARGEWPMLPALAGVVECPVLRPDGSVVDVPGYDEATHLLYLPTSAFPSVPSHPTQDDARAAYAALCDPFCDFPFGGRAHLAGVIAAILTLLGRYAFDGPAPLFAITKNIRGAGGSRLAESIGRITRGRDPARSTWTTDEEEVRKRITSIALAGEPLVMLDNITSTLGGPALESALTMTQWSDRVLGASETVSLPLDAVWIANGNGLTFTGDCLRRTVLIQLVSPEERPESRTDFRYPDLASHLRTVRPELVVAGLTLLRAWVLAGRPSQGLRPWGSYEAWSWLRDAIVWAGGEDPIEGKAELEGEADTEATALAALLEGWRSAVGASGRITAAGLIRRLWDDSGGDPGAEAMRDAVLELCPTTRSAPSAVSLGRALTRYRGRVCGGRRLVSRRQANTLLWSVEEVG